MSRVVLFIVSCLIYLSFHVSLWAGNCVSCLEQLKGDELYCEACKVKLSIGDLKSREEELIKRVEISRENYKKTLSELAQFYLDIGDRLRLKKVTMELDALNEIPQPVYNLGQGESSSSGSAGAVEKSSIEEADILFYDASSYRRIVDSLDRKKSLSLAIKRYERIIEKHPESDKVSDSAYFIAEIYSGTFFGAYEDAAAYYVKCYELDPATPRPALYKAARMYDYWLHDLERAAKYYKLVAENSPEYKYRKRAEKRLKELKIGDK